MNREKIYHMFITIEKNGKENIGFISRQWLNRGIRGFAPKEDKAPWWNPLDKEHALSLVEEFRVAMERDQGCIESLLGMLNEIKKELLIGDP